MVVLLEENNVIISIFCVETKIYFKNDLVYSIYLQDLHPIKLNFHLHMIDMIQSQFKSKYFHQFREEFSDMLHEFAIVVSANIEKVSMTFSTIWKASPRTSTDHN